MGVRRYSPKPVSSLNTRLRRRLVYSHWMTRTPVPIRFAASSMSIGFTQRDEDLTALGLPTLHAGFVEAGARDRDALEVLLQRPRSPA